MAFHVKERLLAYCHIDDAYRVKDLGGSLNVYGLGDLREGQFAEGRFVFLEKVSLRDQETWFFPRVALSSGGYADVHIIVNDMGLWIVFLDASAEVEQLQLMQQRGNEAGLLREKVIELKQQLEAANKIIGELRSQVIDSKSNTHQ